MVVGDMGWVDYDFCHSTLCQTLLRQMGVWQDWRGNSARWWNKGQPNPCPQPHLSPCSARGRSKSQELTHNSGIEPALDYNPESIVTPICTGNNLQSSPVPLLLPSYIPSVLGLSLQCM